MSVSSYAGTYNTEIVLGQIDTSTSKMVDPHVTYYFGEVDDSLGPLAEAAFLSPQSFAGARITLENIEQRESVISEEARGNIGAWLTLHTDSGFYLGGEFYHHYVNFYQTSYLSTPVDDTEWLTGTLGYYLNDDTSVWLSYRDWNRTTPGNEHQFLRQGLGIKHLMTINDSHVSLKAEHFNWTDVDYSIGGYTELHTAVTYYPDKDAGLTFGLISTDFNDGTLDSERGHVTYSFGTEYFFTPTLSLEMSMNRAEWNNGDSSRSQKIALATRF